MRAVVMVVAVFAIYAALWEFLHRNDPVIDPATFSCYDLKDPSAISGCLSAEESKCDPNVDPPWWSPESLRIC